MLLVRRAQDYGSGVRPVKCGYMFGRWRWRNVVYGVLMLLDGAVVLAGTLELDGPALTVRWLGTLLFVMLWALWLRSGSRSDAQGVITSVVHHVHTAAERCPECRRKDPLNEVRTARLVQLASRRRSGVR